MYYYWFRRISNPPLNRIRCKPNFEEKKLFHTNHKFLIYVFAFVEINVFYWYSLLCDFAMHTHIKCISSLSARLIRATAVNANVHNIVNLLNWITQCGRKIERLLEHIVFHGGERTYIHIFLYREYVEMSNRLWLDCNALHCIYI